jgi:hypothetical protein
MRSWPTSSETSARRRPRSPGQHALDLLAEEGLGVQSDLDQAAVRRYAMDRGLVDFKLAAIDSTWSGLRFSRKKAR